MFERVKFICHNVKALAELANFIPAHDLHARIKLAFGKAPHDVVHIGNRFRHAPCDIRYRQEGKNYGNTSRQQHIEIHLTN